MKELHAWLDRRARREQGIPCLDDVFLSGRFAPYAWYRLRLFFVRWFAASAVHVFRVLLLSAAFSRRHFVQLLLAETAVGFASNFWWGALESMRERIRELRREGRAFAVPREIERWLTLAWALAAAVMAACALWLLMRPRPFGPVQLYAVALFVRLALQVVTRTFHSGAYAMRRIYRPGWAVVAVEVVSFVTVILVWPWLGSWALPAGVLSAAIGGSGITLYFTRRMYRFMGLQPRWLAPDTIRQRWKVPWLTLLAAGLSFAVLKLDAVLVFGLFEGRPRPGDDLQLFLLLFVMAPTVQAGFDWAYLFYFDLKRLHVPPFEPLLEHYRGKITRLAVLLGVVFWLLGSVTGTAVFLRSLGSLYWLLGPFFIVRSVAASAQIQAFSVRRYGLLLGTSSLWLVGFEFARGFHNDSAKLAVITLASAAVYVALAVMARPRSVRQHNHIGILEWLRQLSALEASVRVRSARLRPLRPRKGQPRAALRGLAWSQQQFARTLARRLGPFGAVTIVPPDRVIWFEADGARRVSPAAVAALSGGVAQSVRSGDLHSSGPAAAAAAWQEHGLEAALGPALAGDAACPAPARLEQEFARLFPDGWTFGPDSPAASASSVPARWRRQVIRSARRFLDELKPTRDGSPLEVTALSMGGRLRLVFVARANARGSRRRAWQRTITQANVLAALDKSG